MNHVRSTIRVQAGALAATLLLAVASPASAFDFYWTGGQGPWTNGGNWDQGGFIPLLGDEGVGVIGSTASGATQVGGVATLSTAAPDAAGVVLGQDAGTSGTLRVLPGGSINFLLSTGEPIGAANIGLEGTGRLEVQGGGALSTTSLDVNAGSVVEIGAGAGVASVTSTDEMYLNGVTITHGPGHTFSSESFVDFEGQSQYIVDLQASTHTTLTSNGPINNVQGLLSIQTSGGFTPTSGDSWQILSGTSFSGPGFTIDTSLSPVPAGHS
ncbi:MAG: hypothetical protein KDA37_17100, partial [Planctomycetales bacterium]|nr:hypothetical protein [Planctomycetales bacterium]